MPKAEYTYSPRRPPELRFDPTGRTDELPELLGTARQRKLTEAEAWALPEALRVHEPWLEWAGKRETRSFAVDLCRRLKLPKGVSLHAPRHTHGSQLLAGGVPITEVSARLGQGNTRTTLEVHAHEIPVGGSAAKV